MKTAAVYDQIGKTYDSTRRADPKIVSRLIDLLSPTKNASYLDAIKCISTFALENNQDEIQIGCQKLQRDINSGEINKIIASHESDLGDDAFITCSKL